MRELIPFIPEEEYKSIAKELLGKDVSIIFDGTTRDEEALVMLIRYVHEWEVKMRLMRFQLDRSSVNSDELARIIIEVLHRKLDVLQNNLMELFPLSPALQYKWYNYGLHRCLQPAFTYFLNTMRTDLTVSQSTALFKAAQLFSPRCIKISRPTAIDVDWLRVVPFLSSNDVIQSLKDELPDYIAKANYTPDVFDDLTDTLPWWKATAQDLPCWAAAVQKMVFVQPSSAAAERVFSMLVTMFGDQQHEALEDYLEAALMLRINSR